MIIYTSGRRVWKDIGRLSSARSHFHISGSHADMAVAVCTPVAAAARLDEGRVTARLRRSTSYTFEVACFHDALQSDYM